jgi:hypothetical protein
MTLKKQKKRGTKDEELTEQVASQMMRCGNPDRLIATHRQKEGFRKQHQKQILWIIKHLPRCSAAVPAVLVKCMIKYDMKDVARFCLALQKALFDGQNDPAYLLWKFLQNNRGKETASVYRRTVCAAKAYMEGRKLKKLNIVLEDVFDWDEGWTVPDNLLPNWTPDKVPDDITPVQNNDELLAIESPS